MEIVALLGSLSATGIGAVDTVIFAVVIFIIIKVVELLIERVKKNLDKGERLKGIVKRENANEIIYDLISTTLTVYGGERIQVIEFSNGNRNIALVPFDYMNCTYESVSLGTLPMAKEFQRVPTTLYGLLLVHLVTTSFKVLHLNDREQKLPPHIYQYMDLRGADHTFYIPFLNPRTKTAIGYISWDNHDPGGYTDKALVAMRALAAQIGTLLTLYAEDGEL